MVSIGPIKLSSPLLLAPMAGVTDHVFRDLCCGYGASLTFTEMVSAKGLFYKSEHTSDLLTPSGRHPEGAQLFGSDPEIMAKELAHPALAPFDCLDLNMGCPARKIVSNGDGSALMKDPGLAYEIMAACVEATSKPVTVKMRLGWDSFTADKLAKAAERAGVAALTVHARTTAQAYGGKADLTLLRRVRDAVSLPLIGNGDVTDAESARAMMAKTGCDAVMIGRAAEGRPWIFAEILAAWEGREFSLTTNEKLDVALLHGRRLASDRGEKTAMLQMRKHLAWYTHGMRGAAQLRASLTAFQTLEEFETLVAFLRSASPTV